MGLFGIDIPKEFGGPDIDIVTRVLLAIEMAQHRAGLYVPCYGTFGGAGLAQIFEANEDQKERYLYPTLRGEKKPFFGLTEPSGGSDPARAIQTQGRAQGQWLGAERRQDLHLRRRPRAVRHRLRPHRRLQGPRRHHLLHRRRRHAGLPRAPRRAHAALVELRHRARVQGLLGVGPPGAGRGQQGLRRRQRPADAPAHSLCRGLHRRRHRGARDGDRMGQDALDLRREARQPPGRAVDAGRQRDRHPHRPATSRWRRPRRRGAACRSAPRPPSPS